MTAALPVILKQTLRRPGLQESGAPAADMLSGDFTTAQILAIRSDFDDDDMDTTPSADFFDEFRAWRTTSPPVLSRATSSA